MNDVSSTGQSAEQSTWLDHAVRIGLIAYGLVHLTVGWLAVQLAFGEKEEGASNAGALHALADKPLGSVLVWLIAVGMLLLVVWRALDAFYAFNDIEDATERWRKRALSLGKCVIYGALGWSAVKVAIGKGASDKTESTTAQLLNLPAGPFIVGAVGLAVIGVGATLVVVGWTEKFRENLSSQGQSGKDGSAFVILGKVGYIAKGIAIGIVGGLFCYAAITHEAKKSGGLDQALQTVLGYPFGQVLLVAIGLGFAAYGLFCFARARHLDR